MFIRDTEIMIATPADKSLCAVIYVMKWFNGK